MSSAGKPTTAAGEAPRSVLAGTTPPAPDQLPDAELRRLDEMVEEALASGDESRLPTLGYGEITLVLGWPPDDAGFACKRLPVFTSRARFDAYRRTLEDYLEAIRAAGVEPVATELRGVPRPDGTVAGYVVQPALPAETLAPFVLARADPAHGHPLVEQVVATAARAVGPRLGFDAHLANWAWDGGQLTYFDVTTPLIWSADGRSRLDLGLLEPAFPWVLRAALRRFVAPGILDTYRDLRKVYFDLCGNLLKEGLDAWLPAFLAQINRRVEPALSTEDVRRYYRSDRRLWGALLWIRRLDRAWQRRVRRRPYPFLLPEQIER